MFNTTVHHHESKVVAVTKEIVEKSITPDRVTDMYDDVARSLIRTVKVDSNDFRGVVMQTQHVASSMTKVLHTRFLLNGKEYIARHEVDAVDALNEDEMVEKLYEHFESTVASQLLKEVPNLKK